MKTENPTQPNSILFLGTGTSTGVPQIGCHCPVCTSDDPRDNRLRTSALIETPNTNILIDCGPDFRQQILRAGAPPLDALLITHSHYDHVGGIDDLRPYCNIPALRHGNAGPFPVYCTQDVAHDLRTRVPYCFAEHLYPGVPTYNIHIIKPFEPFDIDDIHILPVSIMHAALPILGYRIYTPDRQHSIAYVTDCKTMPHETIEALRGTDTLIINALRHTPHMSHISLSEALTLIERINPRQALLTHLSHEMGKHAEASTLIPDNIHIATDQQRLPF